MTSAKRCMEITSANTSCVTVTSPSGSGCDLSRIAKRFVDPTKIASIGHECLRLQTTRSLVQPPALPEV